MSKRRKSSKQSSASRENIETEKTEITMDLFLSEAVRLKLIKPWQIREIATFFREKKLRNKEDLETYKAALRDY